MQNSNQQNQFSTKTKQTFKDTIKQKIDQKREQDKKDLSQSILGTINSAHLLYKDYNLDMNYIMKQRVLEYQKMRQQPYSQFVQGMVPDNILEDLNALEKRQQADKQIGLQKQEEKKSFLDQQVQNKIKQYENQIKQQILQNDKISANEQNSDSEEGEDKLGNNAEYRELIQKETLNKQELVKLRNIKIKNKQIQLNNNAVNCQLYLKNTFPDVFKQACLEEKQMVKLDEEKIMQQYNQYKDAHPENQYPSYLTKSQLKPARAKQETLKILEQNMK